MQVQVKHCETSGIINIQIFCRIYDSKELRKELGIAEKGGQEKKS